jgi:hypothetical protein
MKGQRTKGRFGIPTNKSLKQQSWFWYNDSYSVPFKFEFEDQNIAIVKNKKSRVLCFKCRDKKRQQKHDFDERQRKEKMNCEKEKRTFYQQ